MWEKIWKQNEKIGGYGSPRSLEIFHKFSIDSMWWVVLKGDIAKKWWNHIVVKWRCKGSYIKQKGCIQDMMQKLICREQGKIQCLEKQGLKDSSTINESFICKQIKPDENWIHHHVYLESSDSTRRVLKQLLEWNRWDRNCSMWRLEFIKVQCWVFSFLPR